MENVHNMSYVSHCTSQWRQVKYLNWLLCTDQLFYKFPCKEKDNYHAIINTQVTNLSQPNTSVTKFSCDSTEGPAKHSYD